MSISAGANRRIYDAINMYRYGFDDYVASRACQRANCFFQAAVLAEQAIEKLFKGSVRLGGDDRPFRDFNHKLSDLAELVQFDASPYGQLIENLQYHFRNNRYPKDSADKDINHELKGISIEEFRQADSLVFSFIDRIPLRRQLRHSLGVYAELYNKRLFESQGTPYLRWDVLEWKNLQIEYRLLEIGAAVEANSSFMAACPQPGIFMIVEGGLMQMSRYGV